MVERRVLDRQATGWAQTVNTKVNRSCPGRVGRINGEKKARKYV